VTVVPGEGAAEAATATCGRCGSRIDGCAFCENDACRDLLCYRCVRLVLRQQVVEPHGHGG
jgi:hypothetical protein